MKMSKEELRILEDSTEEITKLATAGILNPTNTGDSITYAREMNVSEHFLEKILCTLRANMDKWKTEFLYPVVDTQVKISFPGHIKKVTRSDIEKTCQKYDEKIAVIKKNNNFSFNLNMERS
jgi:hypothetical protein